MLLPKKSVNIRRLLLLFLLFLWYSGVGQTPQDRRYLNAEKKFDQALVYAFIHPQQLSPEGEKEKKRILKFVLERFEEDVVAVRIGKSFPKKPLNKHFSSCFYFCQRERSPLVGIHDLLTTGGLNRLFSFDDPFPNCSG